jgi:hypothetical protein
MKKTIIALAIGCIAGFGISYSIYNARLTEAHDSLRKYTEVLSGISVDDQKSIEAAVGEEFSNQELIELLKEIKERGDPFRIAEEATFSALKEVATLNSIKEGKTELIEERALRRVFDYHKDYKDFDFGDGPIGKMIKENFERIENMVIHNDYWKEKKYIEPGSAHNSGGCASYVVRL